MSRSVSILRRYTPPTCTLEIKAQDSALSRWTNQPVVRDVRFQLNLDDPKLPEEKWTVVTGDRTQLIALCGAVSDYVQNLLVLPGDRLPALTQPSASSLSETRSAASANDAGIALHPGGWLNHELHWGNLATAESGSVTQLTTLQLFDLANALDEYAADVLELPPLQRRGFLTALPNWAHIAALVLITVGLSTSALKLLEGSAGNVASVAPSSQQASSSDQQIATQIPPAIVEKTTPPAVSGQKLPLPPVASTPAPTPGTPTVVVPESPKPSPPVTQTSPGTIASYPVPTVPSKPVITGETALDRPPTIAAAPVPEVATADSLNSSSIQSRAATRAANAAPNTAGSTAFDTIPQVAEVRSYFQQRWKPPEGLTQTLEYSLRLDANGSIQTITPLRQASGEYIDRTSIPLVGDAFVSPLKGRQNAKIRLVLEPTGQVQAFLEE